MFRDSLLFGQKQVSEGTQEGEEDIHILAQSLSWKAGGGKEFRLKATIEKWANTQMLSSSAKQAGPMGLGQEANVSVGNSLGSRQASLIAVCPSVKSGPQARRFTCFACSG